LFVLVFALTGAVLLGSLFVLPRSYRATGEVVVAKEPQPGEAMPYAADKVGDPADIESQVHLAESPRLQEQILKDPAVRAALVRECDAESTQWFSAAKAKLFPNNPTCRTALADLDNAPEAALNWMNPDSPCSRKGSPG